ncbi:MAG: hypothetical protein AMXMBFR37_15290 [Steroidobacteraceae bacterium]
MVQHLLGGDHAFAQQELDVAVVARARGDASRAQLVDAAVADVRPVGRITLHDAHRAGRARAVLERQRGAELHDLVVRAPEGQVQEADRIEQRLRRMPEGLDQHLERDVRGALAVGMTAHAVDGDQHRGVLGDCGRDAVLVVLARSDEAEFGVIDAQAGAFVVG